MKFDVQIRRYLAAEFPAALAYLSNAEPIKVNGIIATAADAAEALAAGEVNNSVEYLAAQKIICNEAVSAVPLEQLRKSSKREIIKELGLCVGFYIQDGVREHWMRAMSIREYRKIADVLTKYHGVITGPSGEELSVAEFKALGLSCGKALRKKHIEAFEEESF